MQIIWYVSFIALWSAVLLNLLLTLRIVRYLRSNEELRQRDEERESLPELSVGEPAPHFNGKTLSGEPVNLTAYAGQAVAFVFVSPNCGGCREKVPMLVSLRPRAREHADVEIVLVSDSSSRETRSWLEKIGQEDGLEVNLPIMVAPYGVSEFVVTYNPRGMLPYFCVIDEQGVVRARDPVGMGEWPRLTREWEGRTAFGPSGRPPGRYR